MQPRVIGSRTLGEGRFLTLRELEFIDDRGRRRKWESADRSGNGAGVFLVAHIVPDDELLLIRQFRPPANRLMLEFPAGLIDPGETAEETAHRELYEETGYRGRILSVGAPAYSSPGMTGEPITMVTMEIDGDEFRGREVSPHPEETESIECFRVPLRELAAFLRRQESEGVGIDTKLHVFALAQRFCAAANATRHSEQGETR